MYNNLNVGENADYRTIERSLYFNVNVLLIYKINR